jgi:ATP-binding cassette subfamily C protein
MYGEIRKAFALLSASTQWRWAAQLPVAVLSAGVETGAAVVVLGLLRSLAEPTGAMTLSAAKFVPSSWLAGDPGDAVRASAIVVTIVYLVRHLVLLSASYLTVRLVHDSTEELSGRLLDAYLEVPYATMVRMNSATAIQRVQRGAEATAELVYAPTLLLVTEVLVAAGIATLVAIVAPVITLAAVLATLCLLLLPSALSGATFRRWGDVEQGIGKAQLKDLQQSLGGLKEVKVAARERFFRDRFLASRHALSAVRRKRATMSEALRLSVETSFVVVLLLVIVLVSRTNGTRSDLVALLGLYAYAGFRLVPSANRISLQLGNIRAGLPFASDIATDLARLRTEDVSRATPGNGTVLPLRSQIVFEGVTFEYEPGDSALKDVHLAVSAGEWIGVVGPTGAGKSTLIDVLLGLLEPARGRVLVDGVDIRSDLNGWRRQIGYVPQSFYLLDDTVRQNVAFGVPASEINDEWVRRALEAAQLDEMVDSFPKGLDTLLGERGARLSGGQRQRIAIARALYHDPSVLVLDEATASLDSQTEIDLTRGIAGLQGRKTAFIIAHRLGTVRGCDRLVMLQKGRVTAVGRYETLLDTNPVFRDLVKAAGAFTPAG